MADFFTFRDLITEPGALRIVANRGGAIDEIQRFLADLNRAYSACLRLESWFAFHERLYRSPIRVGWPTAASPPQEVDDLSVAPPGDELLLSKVSINSPGFWEFAGSLNPLAQIREYLKDRHERNKDKSYRQASEELSLNLDNERKQIDNLLARQQIQENQIRAYRSEMELLRELGYSKAEIRRQLWARGGLQISDLARHQDSGLIGSALWAHEEPPRPFIGK